VSLGVPKAFARGFRWRAPRVLAALAALALTVRAAPAQPVEDFVDPRIDASARFVFWSHPRLNLHHFLYQWANAELTESGLRPVEVSERGALAGLSEEESARWNAAVAFYRQHLAERSLVFDHGMIELRDELVGLRGVGPLGGLSGELPGAMQAAVDVESIYRRVWWPAHDAANRAWVGAVLPALRASEQDLITRLAVALGLPLSIISSFIGIIIGAASGYYGG